jgi:hypothetical protein
MGTPTVFPMGTTIYKPNKCWNGYTLFQANEHGAMLIDMNGRVVNYWKGLQGFPNKLLPDGSVLGSLGDRNPAFGWQDQTDLVQVDWDGTILWKFDHVEYIEDPGYEAQWMARQHHDYQLEGNPVGYYVPGMEPRADGKKLLLCHNTVHNPAISGHTLCDDMLIEINNSGDILWRWNFNEHFDELGFSETAKNTICAHPNMTRAGGDWMHTNCASYVGPNKWFDAGDNRFDPENIIVGGRNTNIMAIIDRRSGKIVWQLGPDYTLPQTRGLRQIIGQHMIHMIPKGLPGEGNMLVFDNGGYAGYGSPNPGSRFGMNNALRSYSRVLEFNPVTLEPVWECRPSSLGYAQPFQSDGFFSNYVSGAQRLPNGNTLVTEGADGRFLEVTPDFEVVWEYISPYFGRLNLPTNMVYRAYRYPYSWAPQTEPPQEKAVVPPQNAEWRLPNACGKDPVHTAQVDSTTGYHEGYGFCLSKED